MRLTVYFIYSFILLTFLPSCKQSEEFPKINSNIHPILSNCGSAITWSKANEIYTTGPLAQYYPKSGNSFVSSSIFSHNGWYFLDISADSKNLLYGKTNYEYFSYGSLIELSLTDYSESVLIDSSVGVSKALYYRDSQHIIYYSYGNPIGDNSGYFLFDKNTRQSTLLLSYFPEMGTAEVVNGFDIHPKEDIILIPYVNAWNSPQVVEYNFIKGESKVFTTNFNISELRFFLDLKYNHEGSRIALSCYPTGMSNYITNDDCETGVIDRLTGKIERISLNTNAYGRSVQFSLCWAPNDKDLAFVSAPVFSNGWKGTFSAYIILNFIDQ